MGFDPENPPPIPPAERMTPFRTIYVMFRSHVHMHIQSHYEPLLSISQPPLGAFSWQPQS